MQNCSHKGMNFRLKNSLS